MKIIVIGAGAFGLAIAWALSRGGHRVTLVDRGEIPNPSGASLDDHRVIAHPYGGEAGYTAMVDEAYRAWDLLWDDLGERLYVPTGILALSSGDPEWVRQSAAAMERLGKSVRRLSRGDLERAFPLLLFDTVDEAFLSANGGILLARRIIAGLVKHVGAAGVAFEPLRHVVDIDPERARIRFADSHVLEADAVVVAVGAWTERLLPALAPRTVPSRQIRVYLEPPRLYAARWTIAPVILERGTETESHVVPPAAGTSMKLREMRAVFAGDPDDDRGASAEEVMAVVAAAGRRLRDFERYRVLRARAAYEPAEPEGRVVLERVGRAAWVVSAGSSHGFKFAPLLAVRLADALAGTTSELHLADWAAGRA